MVHAVSFSFLFFLSHFCSRFHDLVLVCFNLANTASLNLSQSNKKVKATMVTTNQMIHTGRDYYYAGGTELSLVHLRQVEMLNSPGVIAVPPNGGVIHGLTRKEGIKALLECPNKYPVGEDSQAIRLCVLLFDRRNATVNNNLRDWQHQRDTAIRYYFLVHDQREEMEVRDSILGEKRMLERTCKTAKNWAAALIIFHCAYGWTVTGNKMTSLKEMATYDGNELVHLMFVLPLIQFFCLEMDPYKCLDPREILEVDLSRLENNIKQKAKKFGVWSQPEAVRRLALPEGHLDEITDEDKSMCAGIEVSFAILFSLIIKGFLLPFDRHKTGVKRESKIWITDLERSFLYQSLDDTYLLARYGEPSAWRP